MAPRCLALAGSVALLAAAAHAEACVAGACPASVARARDSVLLQTRQARAPTKTASALGAQRSLGVTSDCASRLDMWEERNAACLVVQDGQALLVRVPYGSHPGWDLPGGWKHSGEAACQTAEREVCEETGHQVRALEQLSWNVFRCEIVANDVCTKPVDEGFLDQQWWGKGDLDHLTFRADTWGDKVGLMRQHLPDNSSVPDFVGVCGCHVCHHEGLSTTSQQCVWGKDTSPEEACACLQASAQQGEALLDDCGCRACEGEGWSTRAGACTHGHSTEPHEACECRKQAALQP